VQHSVGAYENEHFVEVLKRHKLFQQLGDEQHVGSVYLFLLLPLLLLLHGYVASSLIICGGRGKCGCGGFDGVRHEQGAQLLKVDGGWEGGGSEGRKR
jgi:hypothetical protein